MGTTTNYAIPYPEPTDFVTDGAQAMENIAETVDAQMFAQVANRNLLYNGAMQIAQRSTSAVTGITVSGYYTVDRFSTALGSLGTWTQTPDTDVPTGSGFRRSLKYTCTTADASPAAGDLIVLQQYLEGQDLQAIRKGTPSAQQLTLSFWVKTNKSGTYICELRDADNNRSVSKSYVVNATATWEYKTVTFPADTVGAFDNDNNGSLDVNWWLAAGSTYTSGTLQTTWASTTNANRAVGNVNLASDVNNYWQITGTQLTIGTVAPPFPFKSFGQDLQECQRYFQRFGVESTQNGQYMFFATGWFTSTSYLASGFQFPVKMRTRAATSHNGASNFYIDSATGQGVPSSITISTEGTQSIRFIVLSSGTPTGGQCGNLLSNASNTAYFNLDAEL